VNNKLEDKINKLTPERRELIARHAKALGDFILNKEILRSKCGVVKYPVFGENTIEIDNPTQEQLAELSGQNFAQRWAKDDLCGKMLNQNNLDKV